MTSVCVRKQIAGPIVDTIYNPLHVLLAKAKVCIYLCSNLQLHLVTQEAW